MNTLRQKIASEYLKQFVSKKRDDGNSFYCLNSRNDKELIDLIYNCHDGVLPNDKIYEFIHDSFTILYENDNGDDASDYTSDIDALVDVYNHDLNSWVSSNLTFSSYVDRAIQEFGACDHFNALQIGQFLQRQEIFYKVLEFVNEKVKEHEEEQEELEQALEEQNTDYRSEKA